MNLNYSIKWCQYQSRPQNTNKENIIDEKNKAPENWSVFEDFMCCPQDPSTLKASIIFGQFLQIQKRLYEPKILKKCTQYLSLRLRF